ncbi:MAG: protein kinase domain-containing protein [Myxococcota bacterium]
MTTAPPQRQPTQPILTVAARSIAMAAGAPLGELMRERALRCYAEGVRQYLAIRTGSPTRAQRAWERVRAQGAELPWDAPPGARARLYRLAREVAAQDGPPEPDAGSLPWRVPRTAGVTAECLDRLRRGLTEDEAELLELRHARELTPDEIAFVLDRPVDRVLEDLERAVVRASALAGDVAAPLRALLLEAFALEPEGTSSAATRAACALPIGTVVGQRYAIQERVGTGAFGDVYRAKDTEVPGHVVGLKILHEPARTTEARAAALRELHLIASVFHPSVVQFKDHGWHEGRLWFVMPWYDGETLERRMARRPLERGEARRIFEPLARALATMHAAGIRHQDVKPENIFLARIPGFGGRNGGEQVLPVLLDLGVAAKEAELVVAGTPTYFAPEVAAQFAEADERPPVGTKADVFALALSLRNALEPETQPDVPAGAIETFVRERSQTLPPMPTARELRFLEPSFRRWLSLDPDERPTADELADELAVLTRPEERRRRVTSVLRWTVPAALALLAIFGAVVYALHTRAERQQLLAERARRSEAGLRQDLVSSKEHRRALEHRVNAVRREHRESRLSREQLADELAHVAGEREMLVDELQKLRARGETLEKDLKTRERELERADSALTQTRDELEAAEDEAERASARGERLAQELGEVRDELARADDRITTLDGNLASLQAKLQAERARSDRLEDEMSEAIDARAEAEAELERTRRKARTDEPADEDTDPSDPDPDDLEPLDDDPPEPAPPPSADATDPGSGRT